MNGEEIEKRRVRGEKRRREKELTMDAVLSSKSDSSIRPTSEVLIYIPAPFCPTLKRRREEENKRRKEEKKKEKRRREEEKKKRREESYSPRHHHRFS